LQKQIQPTKNNRLSGKEHPESGMKVYDDNLATTSTDSH
jgi:hypothetical protein